MVKVAREVASLSVCGPHVAVSSSSAGPGEGGAHLQLARQLWDMVEQEGLGTGDVVVPVQIKSNRHSKVFLETYVTMKGFRSLVVL